MLRTLGYQRINLISLLSMRTIIYAVPAFMIGLAVMYFLLNGVKLAIFGYSKLNLYIEFDNFALFIVTNRILLIKFFIEYLYGDLCSTFSKHYTD
jgi:hypothetical protein